MTLPLIPLGLMGRTEPPSFPVLRSTNNHAPGDVAGSHVVNLPAGVQAGDLVLVAYLARAANLMTGIPTPSGWESIAFGGTQTQFCRIIYRIAESPLSTVTVTSTGFSSHIVSNSYCFSKFGQVPVASSIITDTSSAPNPPNLAPSGWGPNPRVLWISLMWVTSSVESVTSTSSGFSDQINSSGGASVFARLRTSRREERAASLNPGAWGMSGSVFWGAATIAVRGT